MTQALNPDRTLLTYSMRTTPRPLEVSTSATHPRHADLVFVVSCPRSVEACTVSQIAVQLPIGDAEDSTNLAGTAPSLSAASISSSDGAQWAPSAGTAAAGLFLFSAPGGSVTIADQSLTIQLAGVQISELVGTAEISIFEWAAAGTDPAPPAHGDATGRAIIPAAKFPAGFFAFDFKPSASQIAGGETVTLTWVGSDNADFYIAYGDQPPKQVTERTWISPQLYATTVFVLTATAGEAGQTVELDLQTTVIVATPQVVEFTPIPDEIDPQQQVTLNWRAINADGVYLRTGQTRKQKLAAVSDPAAEVKLQPVYGTDYTLQAFKRRGQGEVLSPPVPLNFTFKEVAIVSFGADRTTVDLKNQTATLSWVVEHARSVQYQGRTVPASGSSVEHPTGNTQYTLVASAVDGSTVAAQPIDVTVLGVKVDGYTAEFAQQGAMLTARIEFVVENATAVSVANAFIRCTGGGTIFGGFPASDHQTPVVSASAQQLDATHWSASLQWVYIFFPIISYQNIGLIFDYSVAGFLPVGAAKNVAMLKGKF
jgi:hypothetical protein